MQICGVVIISGMDSGPERYAGYPFQVLESPPDRRFPFLDSAFSVTRRYISPGHSTTAWVNAFGEPIVHFTCPDDPRRVPGLRGGLAHVALEATFECPWPTPSIICLPDVLLTPRSPEALCIRSRHTADGRLNLRLPLPTTVHLPFTSQAHRNDRRPTNYTPTVRGTARCIIRSRTRPVWLVHDRARAGMATFPSVAVGLRVLPPFVGLFAGYQEKTR